MKYFKLNIKRCLKIFPFVFIISAVLCFALATILSEMLEMDANNEKHQRVKLGIVGETEGTYLGIGVSVIETIDSSRYALDFENLTEDAAKEKIESGDIAAYVVIPEDFIDGILNGKLTKMKYVTTSGAVGLVSMFKDEITKVIADYIIASHKGTYGLAEALEDAGSGNKALEYMNDISIRYITSIIGRTDIYETEIVGIGNGLSMAGYFLCGFFIIFLLLSGISSVPVFSKTDSSFYRVLASKGHAYYKQVLSEFLAYFLMIFIIAAIVLLIIFRFPEFSSLFPELGVYGGMTDVILFILKMIPAIFLICAYQFVLFEITSGIVSGVLMQFLMSVFMGYITGCIYPIYFFPDLVEKITAVLPSAIARSYMSNCLLGKDIINSFLGIILWSALLLVLAVLIRRRKVIGKGRRAA